MQRKQKSLFQTHGRTSFSVSRSTRQSSEEKDEENTLQEKKFLLLKSFFTKGRHFFPENQTMRLSLIAALLFMSIFACESVSKSIQEVQDQEDESFFKLQRAFCQFWKGSHVDAKFSLSSLCFRLAAKFANSVSIAKM
jgi:hypothetical protein